MCKTFDTVDHKIAEAEFFLKKMSEVSFDFFEFNCYFSAFLSATRSSTLALQQFKHIPGFNDWYEHHRSELSSNELAISFLKIRNEHVHGGQYPVSSASINEGKTLYYLDKKYFMSDKELSNKDVFQLSMDYFLILLNIVYDCYVILGIHIDPQQYFTKEHFASIGRTIDQAECEVFGWICSSLIEEGYTEDDRWDCLRDKVEKCTINHLFYSYIGKTTPEANVPDYFHDFEDTPEDKGWTHIPAGFGSIEDYWEYIEKRPNQ